MLQPYIESATVLSDIAIHSIPLHFPTLCTLMRYLELCERFIMCMYHVEDFWFYHEQ